MTEKTEVNPGDRVRLVIEGVAGPITSPGYIQVRCPAGGSKWFLLEDCTVEIIERPLAVGDEVTEQNKHLLPDRYILVSKFGDPWTERSLPFSGNITPYGPLKLIYIHSE